MAILHFRFRTSEFGSKVTSIYSSLTQIHNRSGQAIVEFAVCLIVVVVVITGLIQIGLLGYHHTQTMIEAREEAGEAAMLEIGLSEESPEYLVNWEEGGDERKYSPDDEPVQGNVGYLQSRILAHAQPSDLSSYLPNNEISLLADSPLPHYEMGLVSGTDDRTLDLLPGFSHLISGSDSIEVKSKVWMTRTKGIY